MMAAVLLVAEHLAQEEEHHEHLNYTVVTGLRRARGLLVLMQVVLQNPADARSRMTPRHDIC